MRARTRPGRRQGATLVYFAMISFALLGLAGLVLDSAFALVTRQKLQSAADTAALEGLRQRDVLTDSDRRQAASDLVRALFDDNLNPNDADPDPRTFSAGPVVDFSGGLQSGAAQTLTVGAPYLPVLQQNLTNDPTGDMVAGTFNPAAPPGENNDYSRADFTPDAAGATAVGNAFLVRLRRTGETFAPGVGSAGPPLPYLFGRGSFLAPQLKTTGILVRGTAIADARSALIAGVPFPSTSPPTSGVTPFAINSDAWASLTQTLPITLPINVDAAGNLISGMTRIGFATAGPTPMPAVNALQLGQAVSQAPVSDAAGYVQFILQQFPQKFNSPAGMYGYGYVPVLGGSGVDPALVGRVLGFGFVELRPDSSPTRFQLTIRAQAVIAPANASAVPLSLPSTNVTADVLTKALTANQTFARGTSGGSFLGGVLLAPALVR